MTTSMFLKPIVNEEIIYKLNQNTSDDIGNFIVKRIEKKNENENIYRYH